MHAMKIWPEEIRLSPDKAVLHVQFEGGPRFSLEAEYLRVMSPSAEVQGHSADQRKTVGGKRKVRINRVEPVGNYAVRLAFNDMHDTGIFSWDYLHRLGREYDTLWSNYLKELAEKGLDRDRPGMR